MILARLKNPMKSVIESDWNTVDADITAELEKISTDGGNIAFLTSTILSPSTKQLIADFSSKYKNVRHVQMDAVSSHGTIRSK